MPGRDTEQTTLRLPQELMAQIREQAQQMGISQNAAMIIALRRGWRQ